MASVLSTVFVTTSGGTVTVPTGAQGVLAFHTHYSNNPGSSLSTISLGGASSFTIANDVGVNTGAGSNAQSVSYATISSTGSQTFSFSLDHAASEGPIFALVFVDGINTSDWIRATAAQAQASTTNPSGTVNSSTTDKVIVYNQKYNAIPTSVTGWTSQGTTTNNQEGARVAVADSPGATSTTFTATNSDFSSIGLVSVKDGSGGGVSGTIAITEGADTVAASGTTTILGTIAITNAGDTVAASGTTTILGTIAITETADTVAANGTTTVTGTISITENADTVAASGSVGSAVDGTVAIQESPDTVAASGTTTILGTITITEGLDVVAASGTTEIQGTITITEGADTVVANGSVGSAVSGTVSITENADTVAASGTTTIVGTITITENQDAVAAQGTTTIVGTITVQENQDTVVAFGISGTPPVGTTFWRFLGLVLGRIGL